MPPPAASAASAERGEGVQTYLTVSVRREGDSAVVQVGGELDLASSAQLEQALQLAWRAQPEQVVVELDELRFIDMAGLRVLLGAQQRAEQEDGRLVLAGVREPVRRVLTLAQISDLFTIEERD